MNMEYDANKNETYLTREHLCNALREEWILEDEEIYAILTDRDFFQPYLKEALTKRAKLGSVSERPIDATDPSAIFLLTELGDTSIIPDVLKCLRMNEHDLLSIYGDMLTEDIWLPFAMLGAEYLDQLWDFATDISVNLYARYAVVSGVLAMHNFHPETRQATVVFIERLLDRRDCFKDDELASFLCDCAHSGLLEMRERAMEFANGMNLNEVEEWDFPMATAADIERAFEEGTDIDFISRRLAMCILSINAGRRLMKCGMKTKKTKYEFRELRLNIPRLTSTRKMTHR